MIAQDSGNRTNRDTPGASLCRLEAKLRRPARRPRYFVRGIRNSTTRATAPICEPVSLPSPHFSTGSDATNRRPPSPVSRSTRSPQTVGSRDRHRDLTPPRCPRRRDLRIARPQGRNDDHRRDGDLRLRPNRPGPSRTERRLEVIVDHLTTLAVGESVWPGPHLRGDGEQVPFAGHAFERVSAPVLELQP